MHLCAHDPQRQPAGRVAGDGGHLSYGFLDALVCRLQPLEQHFSDGGHSHLPAGPLEELGADHPSMGVSTFPFTMFGGPWAEQTLDIVTGMPSRGDTVVGNDVWFGYGATMMPGVRIGDGAVIAAGAMVTADVPSYTIVGGNPARTIRQRFDDSDIERLVRAAWWDWPVELVTANARTIMTGSPQNIERIAAAEGLEQQ
jgi:virginiamycin A acetyltransferase